MNYNGKLPLLIPGEALSLPGTFLRKTEVIIFLVKILHDTLILKKSKNILNVFNRKIE